MFFRFFSAMEKEVHLATTKEEREAIFRFRYSIYSEELKWSYGGVDHERHMVCDEIDEEPTTYILYAGNIDNIKGTLRLRIFDAGAIPPEYKDYYSLEMFPNIDQLRVSELGRFMIRPTLRGKLVLPSIVQYTYDFLAGEKKVDLSFCDCRPGLVQHYRRLGARPYGAPLNHLSHGVQVPLVWVISDYEYFKVVGAMIAPQAKKFFGPGQQPPLDLTPFTHLFNEDNQQITASTKEIWLEMQEQLTGCAEQHPSLLDNLSEKTIAQLSEKSMILEVKEQDDLTVQGVTEREMYIVLDGAFEVLIDGQRIAILQQGEVFGEVAFFRDSGERSATVRAIKDGRVIILRRNFLEKLNQQDTRAAFVILWNLGRILSERLVRCTVNMIESSWGSSACVHGRQLKNSSVNACPKG